MQLSREHCVHSNQAYINITHKIYCHTCDKACDSKWDLMAHRKKEHYDVINICRYFLKGNCSFGDEKCVYRHDENAKFKLKCKFCEKVFKTKDELMMHRKEHHPETVSTCRDQQTGYCHRKENECYYSHKDIPDGGNRNKVKAQVFRKVQESTQPPDIMKKLQELTKKVEKLETIVKTDK